VHPDVTFPAPPSSHRTPGRPSFDNSEDGLDASLWLRRRCVDLAVVRATGVNAIELAPHETDVAIASVGLALDRDLERASHGHERDIEGCDEARSGLKAERLSDDVIDDDIESTRCDTAHDPVPAVSQPRTWIIVTRVLIGSGSCVGQHLDELIDPEIEPSGFQVVFGGPGRSSSCPRSMSR
jgi:hypothetical protein